MTTIQFFQARPLNSKKGNYALDKRDAEELLKDSFNEFEIIDSSSFGNGVLVKAKVDSEINLKYFKQRNELEGEVKHY